MQRQLKGDAIGEGMIKMGYYAALKKGFLKLVLRRNDGFCTSKRTLIRW